MYKKTLLVILTSILIVGCKQTPFPEQGNVSVDPPKKGKEVTPLFVIRAEEVMTFEEGAESKHNIEVNVPEPGLPVVSVSGLPQGAQYSQEEGEIKWSPDFDAANDPSDSTVVTKSYPVEIFATSTIDNLTFVKKKIVLVVHDQPRVMNVSVNSKSVLTEGVQFAQRFKIESDDFPTGPFKVSAANLPIGATLSPVRNTSNEFELRFKPEYSMVQIRSPRQAIPIDIVAIGPRGLNVTKSIEWTITDSRQTAIVSGPISITQDLDVNFTINAEDPNSEVAPLIRVRQNPAYGNLTLTKLSSGNYASSYAVRWDQIPAEKIGTTEKIDFNVCTMSSSYRQNLCVLYSVNVKLERDAEVLPLINRSKWLIGDVRFFKVGSREVISIPIQSASRTQPISNVEIFPEALRDQISWSNNSLIVLTKNQGTYQFTIKATTATGTAVESFVFESLPANWSDQILLGDGFSHPETKGAIKAFPSAQLVNLNLQTVDAKMLAYRNTLIIGTSGLDQLANYDEVLNLTKTLNNVFVNTPLFEKLSGGLVEELKDLGVEIYSRYDALPEPKPSLASMSVEPFPQGGLSKPNGKVSVSGRLTAESAAPLTFFVDQASACKPMLKLAGEVLTKPVAYTVAVKCKRKSKGGNLIVSGLEYADLIFEANDTDLLEKWSKESLK